ncbi:lipoyl synthase, partial [Staphylococcus aureus]
LECWCAFLTAGSMFFAAVWLGAWRFFRVNRGLPKKLDLDAPERAAKSVELINWKHVMITADAREELRDAGSNGDAKKVRKVRERHPFTTIEILPSDMGGVYDALE